MRQRTTEADGRWGCWGVGVEKGWKSQASWVWILSCLLTLSSCLTTLHTDFSNVNPEYQSQPQMWWWVFYECVSVCVQPPTRGWLRKMRAAQRVVCASDYNAATAPALQTTPAYLCGLEMWEGTGLILANRSGSENYLCHLLETVGNSWGLHFLICKIKVLGLPKKVKNFFLMISRSVTN